MGGEYNGWMFLAAHTCFRNFEFYENDSTTLRRQC